MINVLVTSVGGGVGQSVVDSIAYLDSKHKIIGLDLSDTVYARNQCDVFLISPRINEPSYLQFILDTCEHYNIDVLIPGNDGELEMLSRNIDLFNNIDVKVVVSPLKIVASSRNKFNWYKDYSSIINIVPTALYSEYVISPTSFNEISFPVIAKPAAGSASSGIKIFLSLAELLSDPIPSDEAINYVVQPYLMPMKTASDYKILNKAVQERRLLQLSEISCQIVYDLSSEIMGIFVSKNSLKNGVPVTIEPVTDESILTVIREIAEKLKFEKVIGPVNIQGRLTDQGLVFFEMNLRFTGITGNRSQFGFNEVSSVIEAFTKQDLITPLCSNTARVGARQVACTTFYPIGKNLTGTILITGASSWAAKNFIGHMVRTGFLTGKKIILSTRNPTGLKEQLENQLGLNETQQFVYIGTLTNELSQSIGLTDVIFNFASARPPHGNHKIFESTMFNLSLVDLIKCGNPGFVVNMSSQSVYEPSLDSLCNESSAVTASSTYALSKHVVEQAFSSIPKYCKGTKVVNLRLGRLWSGNFEVDKSQFPYRMLNSMLGDGQFEVANPDNQISMLDVDDLSQSLLSLMELWKGNEELPLVLNLGGVNTSLNQLVSSLECALLEGGIKFTKLAISTKSIKSKSVVISSQLAEQYGLNSNSNLVSSWLKLLTLYNK